MDFIDEFVAETDNLPSPERFRRWAAVATVAAATGRRVWSALYDGMVLWPNFYILLVSQAGGGKTVAVRRARDYLKLLPDVPLCDDSITHEEFVRSLAHGRGGYVQDGAIHYHPSTFAAFLDEWGTFLREPRNDTLAMLAKVWDSEDYKASTIGRGRDDAEHIFVNIFAGATPDWFAEGFKATSWGQGLPARMIFVFDDSLPVGRHEPDFAPVADPLAGNKEATVPVPEPLARRLCEIGAAEGFVRWSPEAMAALNAWKDQDYAPRPDDLLLATYCRRRKVHVGKLSLIFALARHPRRLVVEGLDFDAAKALLLSIEPDMPKALVGAGGNLYKARLESLASYVEQWWKETGKAVDEWRLRQRMDRVIPSNMHDAMIDSLINQNRIKVQAGSTRPNRLLRPGVAR